MVEAMEPHPDVPDLVFTANAGLVNAAPTGGEAGQFVPSNFRHPERQPETPVNAAWFGERGWRVDRAARRPRPRGGGRRPAVHARGRADGAAVGLLVPLGRLGRHRAVAAAGLPGASRRSSSTRGCTTST